MPHCKCGCWFWDDDGEGKCANCLKSWTLPQDEWDEMTAAEKKSARKAGIRPHVPKPPEDVLRDFLR